MKTTLVIPDPIMRRLREEAVRRGGTISELVEEALRGMLDRPEVAEAEVPPLPSFDAGRASVDVANREALYQMMEEG